MRKLGPNHRLRFTWKMELVITFSTVRTPTLVWRYTNEANYRSIFLLSFSSVLIIAQAPPPSLLPSIVSLIEHLPPVEPIAELLLLLMSSVVHLHRHNTWAWVRFTPWRNSGELKAPTTLSQAQHRQSGDRQKRQRVRLMEIDLRFDLWSPLGGTPRGRAPLLKGECIKGKDFWL